MMKLNLFVLLYLVSLLGNTQNFPVSAIPDSLKANVHSVVRLYEDTFIVKSPAEAVRRIHSVITVLDPRGQKHATIAVEHDKFNKINEMHAVIYDAFGQQVQKMRRGEISDINHVSNISLFEDERLKIADLKYFIYPYTVEATYEIATTNLLFYPVWSPQSDPNTSIELSRFEITIPKGVELHYKLINGLNSPNIIELPNGSKSFKWEVKNQLSNAPEELAPSLTRLGPTVFTAPSVFEIQGRKGRADTWKALGQFHYDLNKDRDILPENIKLEVQQLVSNEKDTILKIKKVYEYLQTTTRYISIQLGIGGWQTFEAKTVADKGYGDCKALSNYAKALLKSIGIQSFQALVRADGPDQFADFPSSFFNHVILCVPTRKDTIWLECTSQTCPFGYLSDFTGDRYVLLLTPEGGRLVRTPIYHPEDNLRHRDVTLTIDETGNAIASVLTRYTGLQHDTRSNLLNHYTTEEQREWLYKNIRIPSFEIQQFKLTEQKSSTPVVTENLSLLVRQYASKSGNRMFIIPNLMSGWTTNVSLSTKRKSEIEWESGFKDSDSIKIILPSGYKVEYFPANIKIESKFGMYEMGILIKNGEIYYSRQMLMPKANYPAIDYEEIVDFFKKVTKMDKSQIVLVKIE